MGFNVVDFDRKIDVSGDSLSIYILLSSFLSGVDFDNMNCSSFFVSWEFKEVGDEKERLNDKFLVGAIVWLKLKNQCWCLKKLWCLSDKLNNEIVLIFILFPFGDSLNLIDISILFPLIF